MSQVCILTDNAAQFTNPNFPGRDLVSILHSALSLGGKMYAEGRGIKVSQLPESALGGIDPRVHPPTTQTFQRAFLHLWKDHPQIICILHSAQLSQAVENACQAALAINGSTYIQVIDSQTTGVGLGLLVELAARAAHQGHSSTEIVQMLRGQIPRMYTIFYIQHLSYLYHSGFIDLGQATLGEMLKVNVVMLLEGSRLIPSRKVRNLRHMVDTLDEFLGEFVQLKHIALLQGYPPFEHETRVLRERIQTDFPNTRLTEHTLNPIQAAIFGPRSLGIITME